MDSTPPRERDGARPYDAPASLHEQLHQQALILAHVPASIIVIDPVGTIVYWNAGATALFGYTAEEMLGRTPAALYPALDQARLAQDLEALETGRDHVGERQARCKDGTLLWIEVTTTRWVDDAGAGLGYVEVARDITARKETEEELRQSESRLRTLIAAAPIAICSIDARQHRITAVNDACCALSGYARDELIGAELSCLFPAEQRPVLLAEVYRRFEENVRVQAEYPLLTKGGERRTVLVSGVTVAGPDGQPERLTFVVDITDRKRAEEELRQSETRLRAVIGSAPVVLFAFDRAGLYTLDEGRLLERVHRRPGSLLGQSLYERHCGHRDFIDAFERAREGESVRFVTPGHDGTVVVEVYMAPLCDAHGDIAGVIGVATDVTDRLRAEEALRQSEQAFRTLVEATPIGICTIDARGRLAAVNDAYCSLTGYVREELLHAQIGDLHPLEEREAHMARWRARFAAGRHDSVEFTLLTKAGELRTALGSGVTVAGPDGQPQRLAFVLDITDRKRAEEELRHSAQTFRTLIEAAPLGIVVLDAQGRFEIVNDVYCALSGHNQEELLGREAVTLAPPAEQAALRATFQANLAAGAATRQEFEGLIKDGTRRTMLSQAVQITGPDDQPRRLAFLSDITERKQTEERMRAANAALEQANQAKSAASSQYLGGRLRHRCAS
jgi:PAS domain S-box-containing protein